MREKWPLQPTRKPRCATLSDEHKTEKSGAGATSTQSHGHVSELFCSVQGEGPFVGERQVFLRTAGCTATCSWCDTVYSKVRTARFTVHGGERRAHTNPVAEDTVVAEVLGMAHSENARTVSITGGEPLEQPEFITRLARQLHGAGLRIYLETNGMHADQLPGILPFTDVIAMDIKLPSAIGFAAWDQHRAFLGALTGTSFDPRMGDDTRRLFVKIVVDPTAEVSEIEQAVALVAGFNAAIPLVLQPESGSFLTARAPKEAAQRMFSVIADGQRAALGELADVRVIPQCHRVLKVR